jgi:predicted transcriptional regulator
MDTIEIINYLENNNITAYHVNKETGISINTINDLIEGKRKPRRSTIDNLISFLQEHQKNMLGINQFKENIVNEPIQLYGNNISNKDLMTALKEI